MEDCRIKVAPVDVLPSHAMDQGSGQEHKELAGFTPRRSRGALPRGRNQSLYLV